MTTIDTESLQSGVQGASPCGPPLDYDPDFVELEDLSKGKPEIQIGNNIVPAQEPDWSDVAERALKLLKRSTHLRLFVLLSAARLQTQGLGGLHEGLRLMRESLERHWDQIHPLLDPEDGNDPRERVNIVNALAVTPGSMGDHLQVVRKVRQAPLTNSRKVGRFSLRDVAVAKGELPPPPAAGPGASTAPNAAAIDAAFQDTSTEDLESVAKAAEAARQELKAIDDFLTRTVGAGNAAKLSELDKALREAATLIRGHLARRGGSQPAEGEAVNDGGAGGVRTTGEIRSRQDVLLALDRVCSYYETNEPSSPVPLLIRRAQRLISKSYIEIVADLTPGAMSTVEVIVGQRTSSSG